MLLHVQVGDNQSAGSADFRLVAHTCTGPSDSPPLMAKSTGWGAVASSVSAMLDQSPDDGARRLTTLPPSIRVLPLSR